MATTTNLERFRCICKYLESPKHFVDWNFYYLISSCLGRRVWLGDSPAEVFPNLYIMFVADPGIGKSLPAGFSNDILRSLVKVKLSESGKAIEKKLLNLGPDTISFEKLLQRMVESTETVPIEGGKVYVHTSVSFCLADELGTLFRKNTDDLVTFFVKAWDGRNYESDFIKHGCKEIFNTCVNFLGCCVPSWLSRQMKGDLLHEGFTSRVIFLWGDKISQIIDEIITNEKEQIEAKVELMKHLRILATLAPTKLEISPEARVWLRDWNHNRRFIYANNDKRLKEFYARKKHHLLKLATVFHFRDKTSLVIETEDFIEAERELQFIEVNMHRALSGASENPLWELTQKILKSIETIGPQSENKGLTIKQLLMLHFDDAKEGMKSIEECLNFLKITEQVGNKTINNVAYYHKL